MVAGRPGSEPERESESRGPRGIFVGRAREISLLTDLMHAAAAGHGQVVGISGEPGIGKTRLAKEAVDVACGLGFRVFWGRFHEGQYVPPYGPWKQIVRELISEPGRSLTKSRLEALAGDLALLAPDLFPAAPRLHKHSRSSPEQIRVRLIEAVTAALRVSCTRVPVMIVLDNLHCADSPSLDLLEEIAVEIPDWRLLVMAAHRPLPVGGSSALAAALGILASHDHFTPMLLAGLEPQSVRGYLHRWMGCAPPEALVQAVHERTEGNPLFMSEVARLLGKQGLLEARADWSGADWRTRVPDKVLLAIGGRIQRLSVSCREILSVASVIGREFDLPLLRVLPGKAAGSLVADVEEALANWMIEEVAGDEARYRFSHALVHDAVLSRISSARRAGLRLAVGEALERRHGKNCDLYAGELAPYFDCGIPEATEKACRYRALAGERALALCSFDDARQQLSRALALCEGWATDSERASLCSSLAQAQHGLGDFGSSMENHALAFDFFVRAGDLDRALEGLRQPYFLSTWGASATRLLERAISLGGARTSRADSLGFHYGLALYHDTGDAQAAAGVFQRTLALAKRDGDRSLEAWTLTNWSHVLLDEMDFSGAQEMLAHAIVACVRQHEYWTEATARNQLTTALMGLARFPQAETAARELRELAERAHSWTWAATSTNPLCLVRRHQGDLWGMRKRLPAVIGNNSPTVRRATLLPRLLCEFEQGNGAEGLAHLREMLSLVSEPHDVFSWSCIVALLVPYLAWLTNESLPLEDAERLAGSMPGSGRLGQSDAASVNAGLGFIALLRSDRTSAKKQYDLLLPLSSRIICPLFGLSADHLLALLAWVCGEQQAAERHFETAVAFCRSEGRMLELAYTCADFARFLLAENRDTARERVAKLHAQAGRIAERGGMTALQRRLAEQARKAGLAEERTPASRGDLTAREIEVLRLLAEGLSNEQIAVRLFISPRTVANHVQRILEKTGSANRTEAAVHAVRRGFLAQDSPGR
jgi:DNA-binding CsgD family transcriptional regulator